jgi:hypothetical protein
MGSANDNKPEDVTAMLLKAREILGESCENHMDDLCSLTRGGKCPIISSFVQSLINKK